MSKISHVVKRSGAVVPFNQDRITNAIFRAAVAVGGRDRARAEHLSDQVVDILQQNYPPGEMPTVEEIQDVVEKVLIENGHARTAKAYILYRHERSLKRQQKVPRYHRDDSNIPYRKLWEVLSWAVEYGLHTLDLLNARIAAGEYPEIVRLSEDAYERDVLMAAELVRERKEDIRVVIIAGPSSSGKTTTTIKLSRHLHTMGIRVAPLNVDNYFFDLELHPRDEFGDYDFETPQALDLELIDDHLGRLIAGERVMVPYYDFQTGKRLDNVTPMQLTPDEIILIDSLHGLYRDMTVTIPAGQKFKLYIETLMQMRDLEGRYIRWTDLRLMRRMVRDAAFRAYSPSQTLEHWHYVRSSELRNIIPYVNDADYIINSAMPYEISLMRRRLIGYCDEWLKGYRGDPLKQDAHIRASRICHLLRSAMAVSDGSDAIIPTHSLMREFIGGSAYDY